ncbi:hypothetical protein [Bradyrhizobium sp. STM 3561]|uniref:hypothetical protein n=1 Tax=Bradyrhizobium sp. STM 3561 TaxID=578923 RepID=UPI00388DE2B3
MGPERDQLDLYVGGLMVRLAKFGKSRLVPLHPRCATLADGARDARITLRLEVFVAEQGGRLLHQSVHRILWRLSRKIGLRRPDDRTEPSVHNFRHRFAFRTLLDLNLLRIDGHL